MDERDRERRVERRTGRRILFGGIVGTLLGGALGLVVGAFVVEPWTPAHWAIAFAGVILGGGIAMVQGGLAGLESGNPGAEPSSDDDPLRHERSWTSEERNERSGNDPVGEQHGPDRPPDGSA